MKRRCSEQRDLMKHGCFVNKNTTIDLCNILSFVLIMPTSVLTITRLHPYNRIEDNFHFYYILFRISLFDAVFPIRRYAC